MIVNLIKYYWYSVKAQKKLGYSISDFVDQGIGLRVRSRRFKKYWQKHFQKSRQFILKAISSDLNISNILVLGAGNLNDLPVEQLLERGIKLYFADLDPASEKVWRLWQKKYPNQIEFSVCDITGRLKDWTALINNKSVLPVEKLTDSLLSTAPVFDAFLERKFDLVISLNIFSQIGIFWKERLNKIQHAGNHAIDNLLEQSCRLLESEHLEQLCNKSLHAFVLLTDKYFHYYLNDQSLWQTENATYLDPQEYLMDKKSLTACLQDCWLWHLRPANSEAQKHGEIHHVTAKLYKKS